MGRDSGESPVPVPMWSEPSSPADSGPVHAAYREGYGARVHVGREAAKSAALRWRFAGGAARPLMVTRAIGTFLSVKHRRLSGCQYDMVLMGSTFTTARHLTIYGGRRGVLLGPSCQCLRDICSISGRH